jgi:hypothetical protein
MGGFEAITTFNYTDSHEDVTLDRTVDYSTTFDVLLEYRFPASPAAQPEPVADKKMVVEPAAKARRFNILDGLAVRVGVRNIFDDPPPFSNNVAGYPVALEDPRQRFVFFDIEKRF